MAGTFHVNTYSSQVPPGACIYHDNAHPGGTAACTAIRRIIAKAAGRGVSNAPLDNQLNQNTPPNNNTTSQPTPSPQANHTSTQLHFQHTFHPYHQYQFYPPSFHIPPPIYHNNTQHHPQQLQVPTQHQPRQLSTNAHTNTIPNPQANHTTTTANDLNEISVDQLHDVIDAATADDDDNNVTNDTNTQSDHYFCTHNTVVLSNNTTDHLNNLHVPHTLLIDSGASHTMITDSKLFSTYNPWKNSQNVTLADGTTTTSILGSGTI